MDSTPDKKPTPIFVYDPSVIIDPNVLELIREAGYIVMPVANIEAVKVVNFEEDDFKRKLEKAALRWLWEASDPADPSDLGTVLSLALGEPKESLEDYRKGN